MDRYRQNLKVEGYKVYSYNTHVATIDGRKLFQLGYWSQTTQKHINYVAREYGLELVKDDKEHKEAAEKEKEEGSASMLKSISLIAALGDMMGRKPEEKNAWKKRFIEKVPGIIMPDDFDSLPEAEKKRRLDGAIQIGLGHEPKKKGAKK